MTATSTSPSCVECGGELEQLDNEHAHAHAHANRDRCVKVLRGRLAAVEGAIVELAALKRRMAGGRPPSRASDEKTRLVDAACAAQGVNRLSLATMLGVDNARLAPSGVFAAKDREVLMAKLRDLAGTSSPPRRGRRPAPGTRP